MGDHHFDSSTCICLGCDISMQDVENATIKRGRSPDPRTIGCPSTATLINDGNIGIFAVISAPDRLVITDAGGVILRLGADAARAMIKASHF